MPPSTIPVPSKNKEINPTQSIIFESDEDFKELSPLEEKQLPLTPRANNSDEKKEIELTDIKIN